MIPPTVCDSVSVGGGWDSTRFWDWLKVRNPKKSGLDFPIGRLKRDHSKPRGCVGDSETLTRIR